MKFTVNERVTASKRTLGRSLAMALCIGAAASACKSSQPGGSATKDVGFQGTNGLFVQVFRNGNDVVIRECAGAVHAETRCDASANTPDRVIEQTVFKTHLLDILGNTQTPLDASALYTTARWQPLPDKDSLSKYDVETIRNAYEMRQQQLATLLKNIPNANTLQPNQAADDIPDPQQALQALAEVTTAIDSVVEGMISSSDVMTVSADDAKTSFVYHLLKSYAATVDAAATLKFLPVKGGTLNDRNGHPIQVPDFEVSATEVTQAQFLAVMGYNPSSQKSVSDCPESHIVKNGVELCPNHPVDALSSNEARTFATRYGLLEDLAKSKGQASPAAQYGLPTEWEYRFLMGKWLEAEKDPATWQSWLNLYAIVGVSNGGGSWVVPMRDVGSKKPDPQGFYDLVGNADEFVEFEYTFAGDWGTASVPTVPNQGPHGTPAPGTAYNTIWTGPLLVVRGNSYTLSEGHPLGCTIATASCRLAAKLQNKPYSTQDRSDGTYTGFRVVLRKK